MSQTQQLIEQVRAKLEGATDYKIAQTLDLPTQRLSDYVKGKRSADNYACARIAEVLERDPLEVIAQVEAEAARSEAKRDYWRRIFSGLKRTAHVLVLCGMLAISGLGPWHGGTAKGGFLRPRKFA